MMGPRVLQVVLSLDPGGTEQLVLELAARLHPDIPTHVCCLDRAGAWATALAARGVGVTVLDRRPGFQPSLGPAIAQIVGQENIRVIHAHQYTPFVYSCLARLRHPRIPLIFTEHGRLADAPPSGKRRLVNRALAPMATRVFAVSENLSHHMAHEGFRSGGIRVIPNGITVGPLPEESARATARTELGVTGDSLVVGTIARLDKVKNLGCLIEAFASVVLDRTPGRPHPKLVIVGDGPERSALEDTARQRGVAEFVRFLGHRDDARSWLPAFDVYVNSSTSEGVSLTILEAMAAGLPIVATRVGGTPEVVDDSCGRLVPARSASALAATLRDLAPASAVRRQLGTAARRRVNALFTIERMVDCYRDVYREVALCAA